MKHIVFIDGKIQRPYLYISSYINYDLIKDKDWYLNHYLYISLERLPLEVFILEFNDDGRLINEYFWSNEENDKYVQDSSEAFLIICERL